MRVVYLNHTGQMSGAERALLDLLDGLPNDVEACLACPPGGGLAEAARGLGVAVVGVPEIRLSLRLHPLETGRGLLEMARAALRVRQLARRQRADLVHANSVRAGLVASLVARLHGPPAVVHVHDCLPAGRTKRMAQQAIARGAAMLLANSRYTARSFAGDAATIPVRVVHNSVDPTRFNPSLATRRHAREEHGIARAAPVVGMVAQITPWKAQHDAIETFAQLRRRWPDALLLLAGGVKFASGHARYDNAAYLRELRAQVNRLGLDRSVRFLGDRHDLPRVLAALDVFVLPSWEEPFGIAVLEAMAMQLPVVATSVGGPPEIITDGEDGILLPPRQPALWAEAVDELLAGPRLRARMGRRARRRVLASFGRGTYVNSVVSAYADALRGWAIPA